MLNLKDFETVAFQSQVDDNSWLENAEDAVDFVKRNTTSQSVLLYAISTQAYIFAFLIPKSSLPSIDMESLQHSHLSPDSTWGIVPTEDSDGHETMHVCPPLDSFSCKEVEGGEQLIFTRRFDGVEKTYNIEISQRLVHALGLYWVGEQQSYCRLNDDGDIEPVISLYHLNEGSMEKKARLVAINARALHRYMAAADMALVVKFDCTRVGPSFRGWHGAGQVKRPTVDLIYHTDAQAGASYVNGALLIRPALSKDDLLVEENQELFDLDKKYETFKALDWKNGRQAEISCAPDALSSYFDKNSPLPFEITPAFFKPAVLQKYKADSEKYKLDAHSISARAGWYLKTYDVNEQGQVHTYLRYLAQMPYSEQCYWKSFNEWPKGTISQRAYACDILGKFTTIQDPLSELKTLIQTLNETKPDWWSPRDEDAARKVHYPLTTSIDEWSEALLQLDQFVVEGLSQAALRKRLASKGRDFDKEWKSIKLLQVLLMADGLGDSDSKTILEPLKTLHDLRSKVKGHATSEKEALVIDMRQRYGSLTKHFKVLASDCYSTLKYIEEQLSS